MYERSPLKAWARLLKTHSGDVIREEFGIEPAAITVAEALYLNRAQNADAKARQEQVWRVYAVTLKKDIAAIGGFLRQLPTFRIS